MPVADTDILWNQMTAEAVGRKAEADALVILPVASTEQHGPHLATGVDTILCGEVCRRTAIKLTENGMEAIVAPTVWMGLAEHHMEFSGTFTLSLNTWHALLHDLCEAIIRAGFEKILIVNGHGGNIAALTALTTDLTRDLDVPIASCTYFAPATAADALAPLLDNQDGVAHACEVETSMMMAIVPHLVKPDRFAEAHGPNPSIKTFLAPPLLRWQSFKDITPSGVLGDARAANAEKGEKLTTACVDHLADMLLEGKPWT